MIGQLILLFIVAQLAVGHPFYQKQFETIVNRDQCLKKCMIPVQEFGKELSLMKNTNLGAYFDRYAETCTTIVQARQCVNDCGIESNPFELDIMMTHCSFETRQKIDNLMPCFKDNGEKINDVCVKTCGNYENLNDFLSDMTKDLKSLDDKTKLDEIMFGRNHACGIYKCMTKCNVEQTQNHCGIETALLLENILKNIVVSQRHDLERLNLVEVMAKSLPPSCDYFYAPDALFPPQPVVPMMNAAPLPEHLPIQIPNEPKSLASIPLESFRAPTGQMVHVVYHPLPEDVQRPPQPIAEIQPIRSDEPENHPEHPVTHPTTDIQSQEPVVPEPTPETPEENSENIPIEEPKPESTPIEQHPTENVSETHPETIKNIPTQEIPNLEQILQHAQLTMISKQMHVLEKQEQILDKENNKLDYELFQQKNSPKFF